ncbi:ATP-binding protein [Dongshaea marina]|uniref:ATP-binding protein n=1 Tax=Dongshaea marina TaxID=2047966 RepID=UPI0022777206|nr:ATP-binding protein [Dongshaea marina]
MEKNAHWQEVTGAIQYQIDQLSDELKSRKQKAQTEKKECELWYKRELKSRGVDEDQIIAVKRKMGELKQKIDDTELKRSEVQDFEHWYQNIWVGQKPKLQGQLTEARRESSELEQKLTAARNTFKGQKQSLKQQRVEQQAGLKQATEHKEKIQKLLKKLIECKLPKSDASEIVGSIDERLREGQEFLSAREQQLDNIKQYVDHFDSVIAAQAGSGVAETWERAREESSSINEQGLRIVSHRDLVGHLDQIINVLMPQKIKGLQEQGRNFGIDLKSYYDVLADIDRRISTQSSRITREVDEELFLDGVSDSAVRIRSRISELEFWPQLELFVEAFRSWERQGFSDLPDEHYAQSMRRALDIIGRSALQGGISKLLEIELRLKEGNSDLVIRTDRQLMESSSHGMAYLILCKFLLAFTRLLRGRGDATIHWPIDELGTLHHANVKKIFDACENNNIHVLGAFPNPDSEVLNLFSNRYIINKQTRQLQVVKPKINPIEQRLKARAQMEVAQ